MLLALSEAAWEVTKILSAIALLGLTIWVKVMKLFKRKELEKCDACGRRIADKPVKIEVNGEIKTFCCEHCAEAYIKSRGHTCH